MDFTTDFYIAKVIYKVRNKVGNESWLSINDSSITDNSKAFISEQYSYRV